MTENDSQPANHWRSPRNLVGAGLIAVFFLLVSFTAYFVLPPHSDWDDCFRPASLAFWSANSSDYQFVIKDCHMNYGPWLVAMVIPIAILPALISRAVFFTFSISVYALILVKLGAKPIAVAAFLLSYPVVYGLIYGQIDWLVSLGFILSPPIGIALLLAKPQVGIGVVIFWFVEAWREGGWKQLIKMGIPTTLVAGLFYLLVGNWFSEVTSNPTAFMGAFSNNISWWPRSLPFALVFLIQAIRQRKKTLAIIASPLLSPHVSAHGWASALLGLAPDTLLCVVASLTTWLVFLLGGGAPNG